MSEIELKACPFCGSTNIDARGWESTESAGPACDDCGAGAGGVHSSPEENIRHWNTRAPQWQGIESAPKVIDKVIWAFQSVNGRPWSYECIWNGFYWYHGFGDAFPDANPTHWQPLPAPPEV